MEKKYTRRNHEPWEKAFVTLTYPEFDNKIICKIIKRTPGTLQNLARKLKIKKPEKIKIGQIFGKLTVIELVRKPNKRNNFYKCLCECGKFTILLSNTLLSGHTSSCGCFRIERISSGYNNISGDYYNQVLKNAILRKIEFSIDIKFMDELLIKQNFKCALTNLPIKIDTRRINYIKQITTASLDRIDSSKGYTKDNVQWIHVDVNYMKLTYSQDYLIYISNLISNNHRLTKKEINEKSAFFDSKVRDKKRK